MSDKQQRVSTGTRRPVRVSVDRLTLREISAGKANHALRLCTSRDNQPGGRTPAGTLHIYRHGDRAPSLRATISTATRQRLGDLIPDDGGLLTVRALGAPTTTEWRRRWLARHDPRVLRMTADQIADLTADEITEHWHPRWPQREAWHIEFALDRDIRDLYLAPASGTATRHRLTDDAGFPIRQPATDATARGYTADPGRAIDDLAVIDDTTLASYTADAHERDADRAREHVRDVQHALDNLEQYAGDRGIIITRDRRVLNDRLEKITRKLS